MRASKAPFCHPERISHGRGLCGPCYDKARREGNLPPKSVNAVCHPKERHLALGLCAKCYAKSRPPISPEYNKSYWRKNNTKYTGKKFGISSDEVEKLWKEPCRICGSNDRPCIDHCHKTGKIRGTLCHRHNRALGFFGEDSALLIKAARYLEGLE